MYRKLNYIVYRRIIGYYSGERDEDAFGKVFIHVREIFIYSFNFRHAKSFITRC